MESKCRREMLHGCRERERVRKKEDGEREGGRKARRAIRKSSFNKIRSSNIMADAGLTSQMDITIRTGQYTVFPVSVNWAS